MGGKEATYSCSFFDGIGVHASNASCERIHLDPATPRGTRASDEECKSHLRRQSGFSSKNPEYHARTKHIDIQYHFIRECVENGKIAIEYIPTEDMLADGMTKALARDRHCLLTRRMGVSATKSTTTPSPSHKQIIDLGNLEESGELIGSEETLRHHEVVKKWE